MAKKKTAKPRTLHGGEMLVLDLCWRIMRLVDMLHHLPDADPGRIGLATEEAMRAIGGQRVIDEALAYEDKGGPRPVWMLENTAWTSSSPAAPAEPAHMAELRDLIADLGQQIKEAQQKTVEEIDDQLDGMARAIHPNLVDEGLRRGSARRHAGIKADEMGLTGRAAEAFIQQEVDHVADQVFPDGGLWEMLVRLVAARHPEVVRHEEQRKEALDMTRAERVYARGPEGSDDTDGGGTVHLTGPGK